MNEPVTVGSKVTFRERALPLYKVIHGVEKDVVYTVAHVEVRRGGKRVFYLSAKGREGWFPAYRQALSLEKRRKAR